jgi:hypothetical protein
MFRNIPLISATSSASEYGRKWAEEQCQVMFGCKELLSLLASMPESLTTRVTHFNSKFSPLYRTLITVFWLRRGLSWNMMSILCGVDESTVRSWTKHILGELVENWAPKQITLPTMAEWQQTLSEEFKQDYPDTLMLFVDGTVIQRWSSKCVALRKVFWNSKHSVPSFTFSILVDGRGDIVWHSSIGAGKEVDSVAWNRSGIADTSNEKYAVAQTNNPGITMAICGDKAYPCIELPKFFKVYVTSSAQETINLTDASNLSSTQANSSNSDGTPIVQINNSPSICRSSKANRILCPKVAKYRSSIERTFRRLKVWKALMNRWLMSQDPDGVEKIIRVVIALENFIHRCENMNHQL